MDNDISKAISKAASDYCISLEHLEALQRLGEHRSLESTIEYTRASILCGERLNRLKKLLKNQQR